MKITEKQKQQLIDLNDSRVNEILDLGLKVGEWYFNGNGKTLFCYNGTNNKIYGFNSSGIWSIWIGCAYDSTLKKATKQEVEQALIEEAKRRVYKNGNYKCLLSSTIEVFEMYFLDEDNCLWHGVKGDANMVFCNGQWAKIINGNQEQNKVTIDIRFPYTRDKQKHEVFIIEELEDNQILVEFKNKERLILSKNYIVIE